MYIPTLMFNNTKGMSHLKINLPFDGSQPEVLRASLNNPQINEHTSAVRVQIKNYAPLNASTYNLLKFRTFIFHTPVFHNEVSVLTTFIHNKTRIRSHCTHVGCKTTIWQTSLCQNHPPSI